MTRVNDPTDIVRSCPPGCSHSAYPVTARCSYNGIRFASSRDASVTLNVRGGERKRKSADVRRCPPRRGHSPAREKTTSPPPSVSQTVRKSLQQVLTGRELTGVATVTDLLQKDVCVSFAVCGCGRRLSPQRDDVFEVSKGHPARLDSIRFDGNLDGRVGRHVGRLSGRRIEGGGRTRRSPRTRENLIVAQS